MANRRTLYIGGYLAKPQGKNINISAVMVKGYACHSEDDGDVD